MFLPLGTDRANARPTIITWALIALNLVCFVVVLGQLRVAAQPEALGPVLEPPISGSSWLEAMQGAWRPSEPWRLLTYAFLHSPFDYLHIAGNMLVLFVFGPGVEDKLGRWWFLGFYLVGALVAGVAHTLTSDAPVIGASGAIAGVTGAYLVFFPRASVKVFVVFFWIGVYHIPALWFIAAAVLRDVYSLVTHDWGGVSLGAHLGGYAWGVGLAFALLWTNLIPRDVYDLFSAWRQSQRRKTLREAGNIYNERLSRVAPGEAAPQHNGSRAGKPSRETPPPEADEPARLRMVVASALTSGDLPRAADSYRQLLAMPLPKPSARALARDSLIQLANYYFERSDHASARATYEVFVDAYPRDPQAPHARLVVGLVLTRYESGKDEQARAAVGSALDALGDPEDVALAHDLLREIDARRPEPSP